ncbi:hypothetical protein MMC13_000593 [Lambiella insularis]|nr:hypothetical protein [Lambiella insularis]
MAPVPAANAVFPCSLAMNSGYSFSPECRAGANYFIPAVIVALAAFYFAIGLTWAYGPRETIARWVLASTGIKPWKKRKARPADPVVEMDDIPDNIPADLDNLPAELDNTPAEPRVVMRGGYHGIR